jgi:hypothetical protein
MTVCAFERGGAQFRLRIGQGLSEDEASQRGVLMEKGYRTHQRESIKLGLAIIGQLCGYLCEL